jgi:putative hydrolase of the HAD superfamily
MPNPQFRAVFWDFGGVLTDSPFDAFRDYEARHGLPLHFIRTVNTRNPDDNAWARFERGEISLDAFDEAFAAESAALGHRVRGRAVVELLYGPIRPLMVGALQKCGRYYRNACLTNNIKTATSHGLPTTDERAAAVADVMSMFDLVIESSKVGARKPEPKFYELALEAMEIEARQAVYLDDLGINLKPARIMGMETIKVDHPETALAELEAVLGVSLR